MASPTPYRVTSLLWPPGVKPPPPANAPWEGDLGLADVIQALASDRRYVPFVRQTLSTLVTDPAVLAWRQATLADLLDNPALVQEIQALLPRLADLRHGHPMLGQRRRI